MNATQRIIDLKLSSNQLAIVYHLTRKGETRLTDVAEAINITTAAMTGLVDALEDKGLVRKKYHKTDRRVKMLILTPTGDELSKLL